MMQIRRKDIIYVKPNNDRPDKERAYLVLFADPDNNFISGMRIQFSDKKFFGDGLAVPELGDKAFTNPFTGIRAINKNAIIDNVTSVSDETYNKIISSYISILSGNYTKDDIGRYSSEPKSFNIMDMINFLSPVSKTETNNTDDEDESIKNTDETNIPDTEPEFDLSALYKVDIMNDRSFDIDRLIKQYRQITTDYERLDHIFEVFADQDGCILITSIFNILVLKMRRVRKINKAIKINKEEFMALVNESLSNLELYKFTRYDNTRSFISRSRLSNLRLHAINLYKGTEPSSNNRLTFEMRRRIRDLYDSGVDEYQLAKDFNCSITTILNVLDLNKLSNKTINLDIRHILDNIMEIAVEKDAEDSDTILTAAVFIENNIKLINSIAAGVIPEFWEGDTLILRLIALRLVNRTNYLHKIPIALRDVIDLSDETINIICGSEKKKTKQINLIKTLACININKDKYDWSIAPGYIIHQFEQEHYKALHFYLMTYMANSTFPSYEQMINSHGTVRSLKNDIGIPDNYLRYYYNMYSTTKR